MVAGFGVTLIVRVVCAADAAARTTTTTTMLPTRRPTAETSPDHCIIIPPIGRYPTLTKTEVPAS